MRHFINGIETSPRNTEEIGVKSDFTERPNELALNVDSVVLVREGYAEVMQWKVTPGVFQGIPYQVVLDNGAILDYYVDLTDESTTYRDQEVVVKLKRRFSKDNFFERAQGVSFTSMQKQGVVFDSFDVPYVIVPENIGELFFSLSITTFIMTKELVQAIKDTAQAISDLVEAITPNATLPPLPPVGEIISLALKVVAQVVYTAAILVAVIKLGQQLLEIVFPKVRYLMATKVKELMLKSCQYLGYGFQSNLLDNLSGVSVLPVPLRKKQQNWWDFLQNDLNFAFNKGVPTGKDTIRTIAQLFDAFEETFNARTKVVNGVVQFERRDFWQNITPNSVKPALVIQDRRSDEYTLNTQEAWRRAYVEYQVDFNDLHTADDYEGTDAEYSTEALNLINDDLDLIKGLNEVQIPFALGRRKEKLTIVEEIAKGVLLVIDALANVFGGNSSLASLITGRIGVLQLSNQFFGVTKLLYVTGTQGKQPANYLDKIRASAIYQSYHAINEIQVNDYKVYVGARVRISESDFVNLLDNNFAEVNGQIVEILEIEYIDNRSFSRISYKEPFDYADGKVEVITIDE